MKKLNRRGFTLIELLAVIIILGVLLLIAIPSMNNIIEGSKKDAFVSTAKSYIQAVRYEALQGVYELPAASGTYTAVSTDKIVLESGSKKSPYDQNMNLEYTYVIIVNNNGDYDYYYQAVDAQGNGTDGIVLEDALKRDSIVKGTAASKCTKITDGLELTVDGTKYTQHELAN